MAGNALSTHHHRASSGQNYYHNHCKKAVMGGEGIKCCAPCSRMLLSGLVSVEGGGAGGSSEQLPGDRNSRTTLSTCGLKMWLILGSTTWATILSTPCSSMPDLRETVCLTLGSWHLKLVIKHHKLQNAFWCWTISASRDEEQKVEKRHCSILTYWRTSCLMLFLSWFLFKWGLHVWLERWLETKLSTLCFRFR